MGLFKPLKYERDSQDDEVRDDDVRDADAPDERATADADDSAGAPDDHDAGPTASPSDGASESMVGDDS